jgi:tetratricopeptide (TPR) repeat protein
MATSSDDRLTQLRNLLESDPHDAFCMYGIAMEHAKTGRHQEAIAWFDRTIETDPAYCYAWYHKARCQFDAGEQHSAAQTLENGIKQAQDLGDQHAVDEMGELLQSMQ